MAEPDRVAVQAERWGVRRLKAEPRSVPGKGRGLFAAADIASGEIIDRACSVPILGEQCLALDEMLPLGDFYFAHPEDPTQGLMVLGLASLCNHADEPNGHVEWRHDEGLGWLAELVALKAIPAGEEITYGYRCALWFEPASETE